MRVALSVFEEGLFVTFSVGRIAGKEGMGDGRILRNSPARSLLLPLLFFVQNLRYFPSSPLHISALPPRSPSPRSIFPAPKL